MKSLLKAFVVTFLVVGLVLAAVGAYAWRRWSDYLDAPIATGKGWRSGSLARRFHVGLTPLRRMG
jgi:hypothetical protein